MIATASDIATARKARKWSQEELAFRAGISQSVVSFAERGKSTVAVHLVNAIRKALDLELIYEAPKIQVTEQPCRKHQRGFASMSPEERKRVSSMGGKAAHEQGVAPEWTSEQTREFGLKNGCRDPERMRELGRLGGRSAKS
jgi:transcriptional regulator with XRE-family HTH domain